VSAKTRRSGSGLNRRGFIGRVGAAGAGAAALASGLAPAAHTQGARTINVVMSQEPPTLGYNLGNAYVNEIVKNALGNQPQLTQRNDQNDWLPWVAKEVPSLTNGLATMEGAGADQYLQVVFPLREDVVWSDGVKLTAHDYVLGWELSMHPDYAVATRDVLAKVSRMTADGDFRLVVRFMTQNEAIDAAANGRQLGGTFLPAYAQPAALYSAFKTQQGAVTDPGYYKGFRDYYPAAPRHVLLPIVGQVGVAGVAQHAISRAPLGIGPFKVKEWVPGQYIATEAVPTYFLGAPRAQAIIFNIVPDTNAIIARLANGEADVVTEDALTEFNAPDLQRFESQRLIRAHFTPSATWEHIDFNLDNPHLADTRVRKAISHSVNRQRIVDQVFNGKNSVIHSYAPVWRWDYNPDVTKYDFNPTRARQLLEEAGYRRGADGIYAKDGRRLSLKYQTTAGNQARLLVTQIAQQDLKEVGVEITLDYVPSSEYFAAGENPGPLTGRRFELGEYAWVSGDDPAPVSSLYGTTGIPRRENNFVGQNYPGFSNARVDELLGQADNSLDQAERVTLYAEVQKIWTDLAPVLPLYARANVTAIKRTLQNFRPTPTNTPPTWNAFDWYLAD
jgi:peptide/nickel transport system substrate-binding protein